MVLRLSHWRVFCWTCFPILSHIIQINPCPGQLVAYPQIGKRFFMSDRLGLRSGDQPKRLEPLMAERSVLITGCSSGIGLCAAQTLRARGWRVATARQPEDITRLKNEIEVEAFTSTTPSLTRSQQRLSMFCRQRAERSLRCTTMAAMGQPGALEDIRPDVLRAQFEVNVFGCRPYPARHPAMRARWARAASCFAPRCSGSSLRPIGAPIPPRNSPSRLWPTHCAWSCKGPASMCR